MSKKTLVLTSLSLGAATAALWASGFPRRVGLTASESALSLPGDFLIAQSPLQADRSVLVSANSVTLWPQLLRIESFYASLWKRDLTLVYQESPDVMVWTTTTTGESDQWQASVAAAIIPNVDGTVAVHVRERFSVSEAMTRGLRIASALALPPLLRTLAKQS